MPPAGGESPQGRKSKSLGLLSERFEQYAISSGSSEISLDSAAIALGVERRRVYDVVAVLESVGMVQRRRMNLYSWCGRGGMHAAFASLLESAPCEVDAPAAEPSLGQAVEASLGGQAAEAEAEAEAAADGGMEEEAGVATVSRKDKSLLVLSQRFLQLFLVSGSRPISLEEAADKLLKGEVSKTKVRRLYDCANVAHSLGLIEKLHVDSRKPAFRWLGVPATEGGEARSAPPQAPPLAARAPDAVAPGKRALAGPASERRKQPRRVIAEACEGEQEPPLPRPLALPSPGAEGTPFSYTNDWLGGILSNFSANAASGRI